MIALALLLQASVAAPTVGDTVWVRHPVSLPSGVSARLPEWTLTGEVELLGKASIETRGDTAVLRAPVVAWTPGRHTVAVPAPLLLRPDGAVDTLPDLTVSFTVQSVLPDQPLRSIRPQPEAGIVQRHAVDLVPVGLAVVLALLLLGPLHWWWRRRGAALPMPPPPAAGSVPVAQWAEAGEARSVLAVASARLRRAVARAVPEAHEGLDTAACLRVIRATRPNWPLKDLARMLVALDSARFAPGTPAEVQALHEEAGALAARLEGRAA